VRRYLKKTNIRRVKRLLVSRVDRLWRRYFCQDLQYFHITYRTRDERGESEEYGVLSAPTIHHAARKADMAKKVLEAPGWEEVWQYEIIVPMSIRAYRLLKKRLIDIDSFFDRHGKLRV
jgi:hypothetical protein